MTDLHLTFDNGPHPEVTPRVLDVLARHDVTATFFVLGKHLATPVGARLARQIAAAGHRLGNHSYTHEVPLGRDRRPDAVERELVRTQQLLDDIWSGPRWFRPFGGGGALGPHLLSPQSVEWLCRRKHTCVLWSSVPGDWRDPHGWVEQALTDVSTRTTTVMVLHDILPEAMAHLDRFVRTLRERGHTFTTDLPAELLPVIDGVPQPGLERYVNQPEAVPRPG